MKTNLTATAVLCAGLAACASAPPDGRFVGVDGAPPTARDLNECRYEYTKAVPESGGLGVWAGGAAPPVFKRCLELRGYVDTATGAFSYK